MLESAHLVSGGYGILTFMPKGPVSQDGYQVVFDEGSLELADLTLPPLRITFAVFEEAKLFLYVDNLTGENQTLAAYHIDNQRFALASPVMLPAMSGNVLTGDHTPPRVPGIAVPFICVMLETTTGQLIPSFARLFDVDHTTMGIMAGNNDLTGCLSHRSSSIEEAAATAISTIQANRHQLRTMKFCNMDLNSGNDGPYYFAQIIERNHIEPQLGYSGSVDTPGYLGKLLSELERIRIRTTPGMFYLWLFARNIHFPGNPRYSLAHMRNTAYTSLAAGAKGVEFYPFESEDIPDAALVAIESLVAELQRLQPLIANAEPISMAQWNNSDKIAVRTLLCSDRGLLLFFIPVLLSEGGALTSVPATTATFTPPITLATIGVELGGIGEELILKRQANTLSTMVQIERDVRVFYVPAKSME
jgi:hypothetical protein